MHCQRQRALQNVFWLFQGKKQQKQREINCWTKKYSGPQTDLLNPKMHIDRVIGKTNPSHVKWLSNPVTLSMCSWGSLKPGNGERHFCLQIESTATSKGRCDDLKNAVNGGPGRGRWNDTKVDTKRKVWKMRLSFRGAGLFFRSHPSRFPQDSDMPALVRMRLFFLHAAECCTSRLRFG